jgi:hypothetical protein
MHERFWWFDSTHLKHISFVYISVLIVSYFDRRKTMAVHLPFERPQKLENARGLRLVLMVCSRA